MRPPLTSSDEICDVPAVACGSLLDDRITPARGRRLVRFRNCFCGQQAVKFMDGMFLCLRHWEADKARMRQDPKVTEANIKECNARCEKERYARLKAAGLCVTCGKRPNYFGCLRCHECQEKRRKLNYASRMKPYEIHPWKQSNKMLFAKQKRHETTKEKS